jgi:hypothetical protein
MQEARGDDEDLHKLAGRWAALTADEKEAWARRARRAAEAKEDPLRKRRRGAENPWPHFGDDNYPLGVSTLEACEARKLKATPQQHRLRLGCFAF